MKRLTKLTVLSVCLITALCTATRAQSKGKADPPDKRFEKSGAFPVYDAAKDETDVTMLPVGLMPRRDQGELLTFLGLAAGASFPLEGVRFAVHFAYPGKTYAAPRQVTLRVHSTNRGGRRFADGDGLAVLADGKSLGVGGAVVSSKKYQANVPKGVAEFVDETLEATLAVEDFNRLAAAKRAEVKVGAASWTLGESQLKALRRLARAMGDSK